MDQVISAVEEAHADLSRGVGADLGPASLAVPGSSALVIPMAASVAPDSAGVKLLMDTPDNATIQRPTQQSTIVLVDAITGSCEALLDGASITMARTAAASAVATKYLARHDSTVLGFVGAGTLARTHLQAIQSVRPISHVVIWSRTSTTAHSFAIYAEGQGMTVEIAESPEGVVRGCDILCTLTPSRYPVVRGAWFQPGLHVNAVGAPPRPDHREIDTEGITRSRVVVDSARMAGAKSGDVLIPLSEGAITTSHFGDELGQVVTKVRPGRADEKQITLYNSVGIGTQDIATARLVLTAARRAGLGTEIVLAT